MLFYGVNVAFFDQWDLVVVSLDKISNGTFNLSDIFTLYYEHILFFPHIFMILLSLLTRFNNIAEMFTILFLLIVSLSVFYLYFRKTFSHKKVFFLFIPIPFLMFSLRQYANMLFGFQITFLFMLSSSLFAFYLLFSFIENKRKVIYVISFVGAVICGTIASYSSSMGLFVWIVGLLQLLISQVEKKKKLYYTIIWFCIGIIEWIIYFSLAWGKVQFNSENFSIRLIEFIRYFITLIGKSLFGNPDLAFWSGIILLIIMIMCIVLIIGNNRLRINSFLIAILVFSLLTTVLITVGRASLVAHTNYPSRYSTFTILLVIVLYIIIIDLRTFTKSIFSKTLLIILILLITFSIPKAYYEGIYEGKIWKKDRSELAFILYTYDTQPEEILARLYPPSGKMIKKYAPVLERLGYNVFSESSKYPEFDIKLPINEVECLMRIDAISINNSIILEKGYEVVYTNPYLESDYITISGWAVDPVVEKEASGVFIEVDGKPYIAYYGIDRKDVADHYQNNRYRYSGYVRYIRLSDIGSGVHDIGIKVLSKDKKTYYDGGYFKLYLPVSEEEDNISSSSFTKEDDSRYLINVDLYEENMIISGEIIMKGWVIDQVDKDYKGKVTILFYEGSGLDDENYIGIADYYLFRSDVAEAFGIDEYRYSGFEYSLDTNKLENGYHDIYIYALNEDGVYSKQVFEFNVRN